MIIKQHISKYTFFSIMPIMLLFGFLLSTIGIRISYLLVLGIILLIVFTLVSLKLHKNSVIFLSIVFFIWATFLFIKGGEQNNQIKFAMYSSIICSTFMMVGIYYYSLYSNTKKFIIYIYVFIVLSFLIAFLEVNFNVILPTSGKSSLALYANDFKNIPTSTFFNPNDFAVSIGITFIYAYAYLKMMKRKARFLILICTLYIVYFTGSRGVQLVVLLLPLVYSIVNKKSILKIIGIYFGLLILLLVLINLNVFNSYIVGKYLNLINAIKAGEVLDSSLMVRWDNVVYSLNHLKELIIGMGPGGSSIFLGHFRIVNPHNFFLEIIIDYGFTGIILAVGIFLISLKKNYQLLKKNIPDELRASCKATIILMYLFPILSVIPSSLLANWAFAWFPIYLTLLNMGVYKRIVRINVQG